MINLRCLFGYHAVDRHKVQSSETGITTVCRGCAREMVRLRGEWRALERPHWWTASQ